MKTILFSLFVSLFIFLVQSTEQKIYRIPNFRTPKNIAFATMGGGSSHHKWVFEILQEMYERGHNVSFYSRGDQLIFAKDYPMIKSSQFGGYEQFLLDPDVLNAILSNPKDPNVLTLAAVETSMKNYVQDLKRFQEIIEEKNIDILVCDAFFVACVDAAILSNKPAIITFTFSCYSDFTASYINNRLYYSAHPTIETESLWTRAYRTFFKLPYNLRRMSKSMKEAHALQRSLGLKPSMEVFDTRYRDTVKLINNVFGIELARPLSPMIHMAGPIMPRSYPMLDDETKRFLDSHKRVCYIGFGQFAQSSPVHSEFILKTLLTLKQQGHIDGIIWGRVSEEQIPLVIQAGNETYTRHELFHQDQDIRFMKWAPQFGILQHPSTSFFISHGGVGSMHEALFNRVRLFVFPFFGDQPGNARAVERTGIGKFIDKDEFEFNEAGYVKFYEKLYQVAADPNGELQTNVNRYSAYIQLNSARSIQNSADILEESLFASNDKGVLDYRRSVGYDIHWFKRYNLDLYSVALLSLLTLFKIVSVLWTKFIAPFLLAKLRSKIKSA